MKAKFRRPLTFLSVPANMILASRSALSGLSATDITSAERYCYSESEPTEAGNHWHCVDGLPIAWTASSSPATG